MIWERIIIFALLVILFLFVLNTFRTQESYVEFWCHEAGITFKDPEECYSQCRDSVGGDCIITPIDISSPPTSETAPWLCVGGRNDGGMSMTESECERFCPNGKCVERDD